MPSPFPGMDPWLEDEEVFPDLHDSLIFLLREALNAALPVGFVANARNRVWVDDEQRREPDVSVFRPGRQPDGGGGLAVLPGMTAVGVERVAEPWEEAYLEILSTKGRRLVTAVEVLSPSNKAAGGGGRKAYQAKQQECFLAGVNLVEIDLLRGGTHTTAVSPRKLTQATGPFDYHVSVRVGATGQYFAAAILLANRLPTISVPLDPDVPPVAVDLQPLLDRAYDTGRYSSLVRYDQACVPPLPEQQRVWAEDLLRAKGLLAASK